MTSFLGPGSPLRSVAVAGLPAGVEHLPLGKGLDIQASEPFLRLYFLHCVHLLSTSV
ncbi:MAG: hypothetical protein UY61_C0032G0005 [Candidatus Adlerbacteria bacterium GW2011_GWC1_50_9]|uniref:Uncharacterized protein n=1 Tax=Candidatus Adlerbacteria bacterium GW2011_GWC1_50_9 TaxID=1618608 RepID=A0A0G1WNU9_9BACT|nr:MAG: hypothetical protein UY61_C0032G0005 [Candidatus Adlerbacteria bacterium GW2011_GWC1_50_9]